MQTCTDNETKPSRIMNKPLQIRLSGAGGQGLITAGVILAEAALLDGKKVVQTQMYGPSARLGASRAEIIISDQTIVYPEVTQLDVLLCLSQEAFEKYVPDVDPSTRVVVDATTVEFDPEDCAVNIEAIAMTKAAVELGNKVVANVVALGVLNHLERMVTPDSLRTAVIQRVPERFRELNECALEAGEQVFEEYRCVRERG